MTNDLQSLFLQSRNSCVWSAPNLDGVHFQRVYISDVHPIGYVFLQLYERTALQRDNTTQSAGPLIRKSPDNKLSLRIAGETRNSGAGYTKSS